MENFNFNFALMEDFMSTDETRVLFRKLKEEPFHIPTFIIRGKNCHPKRSIIAFGDTDVSYAFCGADFPGHSWPDFLLPVKAQVEKVCGVAFNYALLNFYKDGCETISAHKDDENSLDPSAPIACISLGATRTLIFKRNKCLSKEYQIRDGSLYLIKEPTNKYWTHEIPAEREVKEPRISITFRRICKLPNSSKRGVKRKCNQTSIEQMFNESCDFFTKEMDNFSPQQMESDTSLVIDESQVSSDGAILIDADRPVVNVTSSNVFDINSLCIYRKELLSRNLVLSANLFREKIWIHIRVFEKTDGDEMKPSKNGIHFTLETWYDFMIKFSQLNFIYNTSSFVLNNDIVVFSLHENVIFQKLNNRHKKFILSRYEYKLLCDSIDDLSSAVINFKIKDRIPHLIKTKKIISRYLPQEEEDILLIDLRTCIESEISSSMQSVLNCHGCIIEHPSQRQHDCMMQSELEKFQLLGHKVVLLIDEMKIVNAFLEKASLITENFLTNLSPDFLLSVLFQ